MLSVEKDLLEERDQFKRRKGPRGKKNKYEDLIDEEDHNQGAVLDGDAEGEGKNYSNRVEFLDAIKEDDEMIQKKNKTKSKQTYKITSNTPIKNSPRPNLV